ncbi:MAG: hypothetical protein ACTSU7_00245 [Candidatus Heimdallarchaeaceae archaeon]
MAQAAEPDAFTETFVITIMEKGGSAQDFRALITTYDISGGDKDFSSIANAKGGRIKNFSFQTDFEVTLEGYATQVGNSEGFFGLLNTDDVTDELSIVQDHSRVQYLLGIAHTTNSSYTSAISVSTVGDRIMRDIFKNGHFTMVNQTMTDGICKFTLKFKSAPFAKDASSNVTMDSSDGSATLVVPAVTYA